MHLTRHEKIVLRRLNIGPVYPADRASIGVSSFLGIVIRLRRKGVNIQTEDVPAQGRPGRYGVFHFIA